jgi:hypothetical protein
MRAWPAPTGSRKKRKRIRGSTAEAATSGGARVVRWRRLALLRSGSRARAGRLVEGGEEAAQAAAGGGALHCASMAEGSVETRRVTIHSHPHRTPTCAGYPSRPDPQASKTH